MASTRNQKAGDNQIGHYLLEQMLVEQAASAIYLAKDNKTDTKLFLVTLQPEAARASELSDRFLRRAETLSQIEHPTLLPLQNFGMEGKRPYAIMPYRSGQFLAEKLEAAPSPSHDSADKASVIAALELVKQIADGLSIAHPTGIIHHDLRPENIYLDAAGNPYLLDLTVPPIPPVVSHLEEEQPTELDYQSPEQKAGKALSGRSNIYSLGILLYTLLAGHQPALPVSEWDIFEQKGLKRAVPLNQVRADLTAATYDVVQDSIWQREWSRYETIDAQTKAIDTAIASESAPPPPPPPIWIRLFNRLRTRQVQRIAIAAVVLLVLLFIIFMFLRGRGNQQADSTPDATNLPAQVESTAVPDPDEASTDNPTNTAPVIEATALATEEVEVLPPAEEEETPTTASSPTTMPAAPTTALETVSPSPSPTSATTETPTPTLEPTESACVPAPPPGWVRYAIQSNDSLSGLSQATGTTIDRLQEVNCLDNIILSIGQELWLPSSP